MSGRLRLVIIAVGCVAVLAVGLMLYCRWAIRQVQPFYSAALEIDPRALEDASLKLEGRVSALVSDAVENDTWQAAFSDEEVNGWLAAVLPAKFADLLPETISDLRVGFSDGKAAIGFRYQDADFDCVVSLRVNAVVDDTDVVAIRLLDAHAGTLPIPLAQIVASIAEGALQQQIAVRWTQQDGDPVALIPIGGMLSTSEVERRLDAVEFHQGELYVAGSTKKVVKDVEVTQGHLLLQSK
jgi:hypothetical protein